MLMKTRSIRGLLVGTSLLWTSTLLAQEPCRKHWLCIDNCATIPPGVQPAPPGFYVNQIFRLQDTLAEQDDFVIYKHMWYRGGKELGPLGRYQLDVISKRLPTVPFPVVIATSKNDELDEARREAIINMLALRGFSDPTRVIVAYPIAEGLSGEEAVIIANRAPGRPASGFGAVAGVNGLFGFAPGVPGLFGFGGGVPGLFP